jgi:hypothetical protein
MGSFTPHRGTHRFISILERMTHPYHGNLPFTGIHIIPSLSQRGTTHPHHGNTQLMGFLTPHKATQHSISVSERNNTPISWEHPTHGLSHRSNHSVCVLEDVSHNYNHQHSLSAKEAFSTRSSFSCKYSNFFLASGLMKIYAICSWVARYSTCTTFLCTMSLI